MKKRHAIALVLGCALTSAVLVLGVILAVEAELGRVACGDDTCTESHR